MATETLTFANYDLGVQPVEDIYNIGDGVIPEVAKAFGHQLSGSPDAKDLGDLIGKVGPAKELQSNIAGVQQVLGTTATGVTIARGWVERSGLLVPVDRSYFAGDLESGPVDIALMSGGVRNYMFRRKKVLEDLHEAGRVQEAVLVAGKREMKPAEGPEVRPGMTEADYMRDVVANQLSMIGVAATVVEVDSERGADVMRAGAQKVRELTQGKEDAAVKVAVVSNAGSWTQNGGQFRRALRSPDAFGPDFDRTGSQLTVVSDGLALGLGAGEPTLTHQNPYSAIGQIVRNAQELASQY